MKPVVSYEGVYGDVVVGRKVIVSKVRGHPKLNEGTGFADTALTSRIVEVLGDGAFETENTVYRPVPV